MGKETFEEYTFMCGRAYDKLTRVKLDFLDLSDSFSGLSEGQEELISSIHTKLDDIQLLIRPTGTKDDV